VVSNTIPLWLFIAIDITLTNRVFVPAAV
jgi:hypothetical protein